MAQSRFSKHHGSGTAPENREERIGEQIMEHVGHTEHMSEHLGKLPDVTRKH
jgi:hypothetical protein